MCRRESRCSQLRWEITVPSETWEELVSWLLTRAREDRSCAACHERFGTKASLDVLSRFEHIGPHLGHLQFGHIRKTRSRRRQKRTLRTHMTEGRRETNASTDTLESSKGHPHKPHPSIFPCSRRFLKKCERRMTRLPAAHDISSKLMLVGT